MNDCTSERVYHLWYGDHRARTDVRRCSTGPVLRSWVSGRAYGMPVGLPSDATVSINPDADIFRWFLSAEVVVPRGFMLHPHAAVIDPIVFVERLKNDAQSALDFCEGRSLVEDPRQRAGALQKDLKRLKEVMG